jgi:hypothetical protein
MVIRWNTGAMNESGSTMLCGHGTPAAQPSPTQQAASLVR